MMGAAGSSVRTLSPIGLDMSTIFFCSIPVKLPIEADSRRVEAETTPSSPASLDSPAWLQAVDTVASAPARDKISFVRRYRVSKDAL